MRTFAGIILSVVAILVIVGLGAGVYNAGIQQGIIEAGRVPAGQVVQTGYHYGWGGAGVFGFLIPLLFVFILFGLIRAAFGGGRGWGHGHRGGYGPGWGRDWDGDRGPGGWREERERRMADLHRRFHEAEGTSPGTEPGSGARTS